MRSHIRWDHVILFLSPNPESNHISTESPSILNGFPPNNFIRLIWTTNTQHIIWVWHESSSVFCYSSLFILSHTTYHLYGIIYYALLTQYYSYLFCWNCNANVLFWTVDYFRFNFIFIPNHVILLFFPNNCTGRNPHAFLFLSSLTWRLRFISSIPSYFFLLTYMYLAPSARLVKI